MDETNISMDEHGPIDQPLNADLFPSKFVPFVDLPNSLWGHHALLSDFNDELRTNLRGLLDFLTIDISFQLENEFSKAKSKCDLARLTNELAKAPMIDISIEVWVSLKKMVKGRGKAVYLRSRPTPILRESDIHGVVDTAKEDLLNRLEKASNAGSGWELEYIRALSIGIIEYQPFRTRNRTNLITKSKYVD